MGSSVWQAEGEGDQLPFMVDDDLYLTMAAQAYQGSAKSKRLMRRFARRHLCWIF